MTAKPGERGLFDTLRDRKLSDDACFLCGAALTTANRSDEHVIPRWTQERFDLWHQELVLLNGTSIQYRYLKIPCCKECNGRSLQPIETAMATATLAGADAVRAMGQQVIFTWLGKIFYGLIHRELFLALNRRAPKEGSIATPDLIQHFSLHHLFLQGVRVPVQFMGDFPASIFVYETLEPPDPRHRWDFRDSLPNLFISVRVGKVGMIAVLQDGGVQASMRPDLEDFFQFPLHPIQHSELAAQICYKSTLATRAPKYVMFEGAPGQPIGVIQAPLGGLSGIIPFRNWRMRQYASLLSQFTQLPVSDLYDAPTDRVMSWIRKPDGSFNRFAPESVAPPAPNGEHKHARSAKKRRSAGRPRTRRHR